MTAIFTVADWSEIRVVAFDVDGTLYRQSVLRLKMMREMVVHAIMERNLDAIRVVSAYRLIRERLGDEEATDFERQLIAETAQATSRSPGQVRALVTEWLLKRPLPHLRKCLYAGVTDLFTGIEREGKTIGILSDYPATDKLSAMRLAANYIVDAGDVGVLKPHPKGLQLLMSAASVSARETLFVGDRAERDGLAGQRAGVRTLIRSAKPIAGFQTFASFRDPLFAPFLSTK
jgi:FMN phosphatase YigB (HAD superfamily)